jgi:hypothetical protein
MYPFIRMSLVLRSETRKPPLGLFDTHARPMMCLPMDADMFWEMNNGRILTFCDLGRFGLAQRLGPLRAGSGHGPLRMPNARGRRRCDFARIAANAPLIINT